MKSIAGPVEVLHDEDGNTGDNSQGHAQEDEDHTLNKVVESILCYHQK